MHPLFSSHQPYFTPNWVNFSRTPVSQFVSLAKKRSRVILSILRLEMPCFCKYYRLPLRLSPFRPLFHRPNTQAAPRFEKQYRFSIPPLPAGNSSIFCCFFSSSSNSPVSKTRGNCCGRKHLGIFSISQCSPAKRIAIVCLFPALRATRHLTRISVLVHRIISRLSIFFFSHFSSKAPFLFIFNFKINLERFWSIFWQFGKKLHHYMRNSVGGWQSEYSFPYYFVRNDITNVTTFPFCHFSWKFPWA